MMTLDEFWIVLEDSLNKMQRLSMLTLRHWPESEVVKWRRTPIANSHGSNISYDSNIIFAGCNINYTKKRFH